MIPPGGSLRSADPMLRQKPDPIPVLHPVPEFLADARLKAVYDDTKAVLRVPWMGVVTMAFAHYPTFYAALWDVLRDLCDCAAFVAACRELRTYAETQAASLGVTRLSGRLATHGYAQREIDEIRDLIEVFSHGNMPYLMLATVARLLLEGEAVGRHGSIASLAGQHDAVAARRLTLIEPHHADAPTATLYDDIRVTLGLPFVNTDYRALARWPSYFALAWGDLRGWIDSSAYVNAAQSVHEFAIAQWQQLPVPAGLTSATLNAAAERDAPPGEVRDVVRLFQWLLPGLVINVACFRAQLRPE